MTLDLHQRKALAESIWNARDFVIDCRIDLGKAGADEDTLRGLQYSINQLAIIAEKMERPTPEDELKWGKALKAYKKEDADWDACLLAEETDEQHRLDVNMNRYAGVP
jgi:hypothetical protein